MAYQAIFRRYELKFMLTREQKKKILLEMEPYMVLDKYGRSTVRNIYFDTDNYRLIRRSLEKPAYKEKLRVRSYRTATSESAVFVELKKKYDHVVYKRRIALAEKDAMAWLLRKAPCPEESQISREIDYFMHFYKGLRPAVFLSYEREAFCEKNGGDLRITFDDNILCRRDGISLTREAYGVPILRAGAVLMEVKCSGGMPLWMLSVLSHEQIYKTSFSKYGEAYKQLIFPETYKTEIFDPKEILSYECDF